MEKDKIKSTPDSEQNTGKNSFKEVTSNMVENAHASGDGAIKRSDESIIENGEEEELKKRKETY